MASPEKLVGLAVQKKGPAALGARVRALRERERYSQKLLGELAGMSESGIAKIERGESASEPDTLRRIAEALAGRHGEDAPYYYRELMDAAGYLEGIPGLATATPGLTVTPPKPTIQMITRGIRDNPNLPEDVQNTIITILNLTAEINRRAAGAEAPEQ